ncbi:MAG: ABC transporter permease [Flavobacteriales bacterium]
MKDLLRKLGLGLSVLLGVVTLVFAIFSLGADPVENLVSENTSEEVKQAIRRKYNLDLGTGQRYLLFLNDLSPLSIHNPNFPESRLHFDDSYAGVKLIGFTEARALYLKSPYLGRSFVTDRSVSAVLGEAIPGTALLALVAITIALVLGIGLGTLAAVRPGSLFDRLALVLAALGMSGPSFFMAMLMAWLGGWVWYETTTLPVLPFALGLLFALGTWFAKRQGRQVSVLSGTLIGVLAGVAVWIVGSALGWNTGTIRLPGTGLSMSGSLLEVDVWEGPYLAWENVLLPAITLGIRPLAVVVQLMRNALLEVLSQDYIRTARAKGLSEWRVVLVHGVRNALNPVITAVSGWFASMLAGAVFVEFVFGWRGLGLTTYSALEQNDMPVVMGAVILIAATFVVINLLVDVLYAVVDPRVRSNR